MFGFTIRILYAVMSQLWSKSAAFFPLAFALLEA